MKPTQKSWVLSQLETNGEISRNQCLANFISRLGAIVLVLKNEGWELEGEWRGGDYVYKLLNRPKVIPSPQLEASRRMETSLAQYD